MTCVQDGLLDINHGSDFITVSWSKFSGHWKGSLIGHSDNNAGEDTGKLHVTYHHNSFIGVNSRLPSVRFGTVHGKLAHFPKRTHYSHSTVFNSHVADTTTSGINSRMGANVLVENSVFDNVPLALVTNLDSDLEGYIKESGNILTGTSTKRITKVSTLNVPYSYSLEGASAVKASVASGAGVGKVAP